MQLRKLSVVLLAAVAMVPMVSADNSAALSGDPSNLNIAGNSPPHQIPDDYLKDSKPAEWLPESEMTNIILSQRILEQYGQSSKSELIEIPLTYLESKSNFIESETFPGYTIEDGISPDERIILIRMPTQLYNTFIKENVNGKLTLPSAYFCRFYTNFEDLKTHITEENGSVQITPSSQYPVPGLSDENSTPINAHKISSNKASTSLTISGIENVESTLIVPQKYTHWARSWRTSTTNYKYCIGRIKPYSWSLSGSGVDLFKLFQEREYKFNNGEALEIVVQYFDRNDGAGIELYPVFYRNGATISIGTGDWSHWGGPVVIDPNDIPHTYGYHVQTTNSGSGYQVNFEDMDTSQWISYYTVTAASTVSSFTELDGSSEYNQINVPSTDTFSATTNPVIDEWVIDVNDDWHYPINAWQDPIMDPTTTPPYVSVVPAWDSNGNLITRSYAHYP